MPAGLLFALVLAAPGSGRLHAHVERCPPGFESELRRLLTIELKTPMVDAAAEGDSTVQVRCGREQYHVVLSAPQHAPVEFDVDVTELAPLAVLRAVTLVVAEALTRLWRSPPDAPLRPEPPSEEKQPPPAVTAPAPAVQFEVALLGVSRLSALPLFGGGVVLDVGLLPWLGARVDVAATRGGQSRVAGTVTATLFDASLSLDLRVTREHWVLRAGPGFRAGYALLTGVPSSAAFRAGNVGGVLWGPQLGVSGAWRPTPWLSLGLGADGGVWAPRLEGLVIDESPVRLDGLFASLWVSAGLRW